MKNRRTRKSKSIKRKSIYNKKGGSSPKQQTKPTSETTADKVFENISHIKDTVTPRFYPNKKLGGPLIQWIKYLGNPTKNMPQYTKARGITGTRLLSPSYIEKYKPIAEIWGYSANPYINYERLTHHSYQDHPLRLFQDFSDPLMRNLVRLSNGEELLSADTTQFLSKVYPTIDFFESESSEEYVNWFCGTVLPHFLSQSNVSTLLYELADQKWNLPAVPSFDDEQVLLYLSLVARLFLLLLVKDWERMRDLLEYAGIYKV